HAHGLDDAPSPEGCPEAERGARRKDHPEGDVEFRSEVAGREEQDRDDPHRLLGVVGAVADAVGGGRDELAAPEEAVHAARGRGARITDWSTMLVSTTPLPTVVATCTPKANAAMKLKKPAQMTAWNGVRTRVETTVAIEFAASWKPLMKSKTSATKMMKTTAVSTRAESA